MFCCLRNSSTCTGYAFLRISRFFSSMTFSPLTMNWNWKFNFQRNLNDREVEKHATLMSSTKNINMMNWRRTRANGS